MIFVTKYRRKILTPIRDILLDIMLDIANRYDFEIKTQEIDKDHIHLLIETMPTIAPSQVCIVLKQESTTQLWKLHPTYMKRAYWKEHTLWSDGYFVCTIGNASEETIRRYIENQGNWGDSSDPLKMSWFSRLY